MHEVVKASRALHEVVETTHDTEDTKGENPNTDDGDDGSLSTDEETEQTEEGCDDVDNKNGTCQLPRRNRGPERTVGTGDEDQPVLSEGNLQEENLIADTKVLDDTTVFTTSEHGSEGDPSTDGKDNTEQNGHSPEFGQVPLDRSLGVWGIVVGDGEGGDIGENGNEHNQLQVEGLVEDGDPQTQEDFQMKRQGDTVDNVGVHAVENLP